MDENRTPHSSALKPPSAAAPKQKGKKSGSGVGGGTGKRGGRGGGNLGRERSVEGGLNVDGPSTPTKRKRGRGAGGGGGGSGGGTSGGGRGRGRRSKAGTAGRNAGRSETRESTATRGASASVVPGQSLLDEEPRRTGEGYEEEEEEEEDFGEDVGAEVEGDDLGLEEDEWNRQDAIHKDRAARTGPLIEAMDDEQRERFYAYRNSKLERRHVRRLVNHLTSQSVTDSVAILATGAAKVFIGELVEKARSVQQMRGASGPLRPEHLLEAHRQYIEEREKPGRYAPGTPNAGAGIAGNGHRRKLF